ncbi:MAG: hypothetical protein WBP26_05510 [Candidatus Saccharimonadales bacterium]
MGVCDPSLNELAPTERLVPDISGLPKAVLFDGQVSDEHLDLLHSGIPLVNQAFHPVIAGAQHVEVFPDKIVGSERSAHGVGFGRVVHSQNGRRGLTTAMDVALKPFTRGETAQREANGYLTLGGLAIETYEPVGIFPAKHGDHLVALTKTRRDLDSLDRSEWVSGARIDSERSAEIAARNERNVSEIATVMAFLNAKGYFHPDGQIKNWAVTPEGNIGVIDTENFHHLPLGDFDAAPTAWENLDKLVRSLVLNTQDQDAKMFGVGMFADMSVQQVRAAVQSLIIEPYQRQLEQVFMDTTSAVEQQQVINLEEGVVTRFNNTPEWPSHIVNSKHQHHVSHL